MEQQIDEATAVEADLVGGISAMHARPGARVAWELRQWIGKGSYAVGDVLPSSRELSRVLSVDRRTARKAIERLVSEGLVAPVNDRDFSVVSTGREASLMNHTVAVVTSREAVLPEHRRQGWSDYLSQGVMGAAFGAGYHVSAVNPLRIVGEGIRDLVRSRPMGVVIVDARGSKAALPDWLARLRSESIPVVLYGDHRPGEGCDSVVSDHAFGGHAVTRWLIGKGCRRIVPVGPEEPDEVWWARRLDGYRRAMAEAGLECVEPVALPALPQHADPAEQLRQLTRLVAGHLAEHMVGATPADALMAPSDALVFALAGACRLFRREPQRDVLIAGYDHYWMDMAERNLEPTPPAVTVDKRNEIIGTELFRLLSDRIAGRLPPEPQHRVVVPELIEITS